MVNRQLPRTRVTHRIREKEGAGGKALRKEINKSGVSGGGSAARKAKERTGKSRETRCKKRRSWICRRQKTGMTRYASSRGKKASSFRVLTRSLKACFEGSTALLCAHYFERGIYVLLLLNVVARARLGGGNVMVSARSSELL